MERFIENSLSKLDETKKVIEQKYKTHIREKALENVNKELKLRGLKIENIEKDDYEILISEEIKEIEKEYASTGAKVALSLLGLDLLLF